MNILEQYKRAKLYVKACEIAGQDQDVAEEYEKAKKQFEVFEEQVEGVIADLDDPGEKLLLRLRYINGLPWGQVFNKMAEAGLVYCDRQLYRIHRKAKEKVNKYAQESTRTDAKSKKNGH